MQVSRPSGRRAFALMVAPLLDTPPGSAEGEAVSVAFITDPETGTVTATEVLEQLYTLTHAEAELVRMLAEGRSLEQVAAARSVTMNTVRSQLKQVFSKTDTNRQGELRPSGADGRLVAPGLMAARAAGRLGSATGSAVSAAIRSSSGGCVMNRRAIPLRAVPDMPNAAS